MKLYVPLPSPFRILSVLDLHRSYACYHNSELIYAAALLFSENVFTLSATALSHISCLTLLHNFTSSAIPEILIRWNFPLDFLSYRNYISINTVTGDPGHFLSEDPNLTPLSVQLPMPPPHQVSTDRGPGIWLRGAAWLPQVFPLVGVHDRKTVLCLLWGGHRRSGPSDVDHRKLVDPKLSTGVRE